MAAAAMGKQVPAEEVLPVQDSKHEDETRREKVAKAMLSPTVPNTAKSVSMASEAGYDPNGSVWEQWLATQKAKADGSLSMKSRVQSARRPRSDVRARVSRVQRGQQLVHRHRRLRQLRQQSQQPLVATARERVRVLHELEQVPGVSRVEGRDEGVGEGVLAVAR